jgi:hypothetical protein
MRAIGKRLAALAILGGLIPASALAQKEKPLCRTVFQFDARTTISDVLQIDSNSSISLSRRVTIAPVRINPAWAHIGKDARSPKLQFDITFDNFEKMFDGIYEVHAQAVDFDQTNIFVAAIVDGDPGSWSRSLVFSEDGALAARGETSRDVTLFSSQGTRRLVQPGQTLELRLGDLRGITDFDQRQKASYQLSRYSALASYDRQAQHAAFYNGQDRISTLLVRAMAGQCAPYELQDACFLTTASCDVIGLADDCWELRTLRHFRDGWLAHQPGGAADIARYYREAPAIAQRLRANPAQAVREYWRFVLPSALAAAVGANRLARRIYTRGMNRLSAG